MRSKEELKGSWFIPLRLAIFLLLFGAVVLAESSRAELFWPFLLYSGFTIVFVVLVDANLPLIRPWFVSAVVFIQITLELVVESTLTQGSGQLTSQFSVLFLLTIISASLAHRLIGTLAVATLAAVIFSVQTSVPSVFSGLSAFELRRVGEAITRSDDVFYAVFLHVCTFYIVAFISGYLAEKLRVKEGELSSTSKRLERARLDTDDILLNLHSGILTVDNSGTVVYFNRAAESILGFREKDVRGRSFTAVFQERMPELVERIGSVFNLAKPNIRSELEIRDGNGNTLPLGLSASILGDEHEGIRGVIAVFQDLTAPKKLEKALMKANRLAAVGEISARIAHEIRNPLASISGSVEVLMSELHPAGENQRLMELIVRESQRLSRILTNFLSYARNQPTKPSKVELVSLVGETVELLRHDRGLPDNIEISFRAEATTAYVVADQDQLKQVLINLITNAAEAVDPNRGIIEVSIGDIGSWEDIDAADWLELTISDNGCGFDPADGSRVFEPFFSRKRNGTGLGLAIVKRCVDNLGARIRVETQPGEGTTFSLALRKYLLRSESPESEQQPAART